MPARVAVFAYGVACYLVFFATFLYAIGFIGDLLVPRSIDSGAKGPTARTLLIDVGLLEHCVREDLNARAPRAMAVLRPLKLVLTNFPPGQVDDLQLLDPGSATLLHQLGVEHERHRAVEQVAEGGHHHRAGRGLAEGEHGSGVRAADVVVELGAGVQPRHLARGAVAVAEAGCFALVLEGVMEEIAVRLELSLQVAIMATIIAAFTTERAGMLIPSASVSVANTTLHSPCSKRASTHSLKVGSMPAWWAATPRASPSRKSW